MKAHPLPVNEVGLAFESKAFALVREPTKRGRRSKTLALIKALRSLDLMPSDIEPHGFGIGSDRNGDAVIIVYGESK